MDEEARSKALYEAIMKTLSDIGMMGLLTAVGDARTGVPWYRTSPKTRQVFYTLRANLTEAERKA